MPPSSALLVSSLAPPGPELQRLLDQGKSRSSRWAAETSSDKPTKDILEDTARDSKTFKNAVGTATASVPSFVTQAFPELRFLRTLPTSNIEVLFYSERVLAERQADFHRRLYDRLEEVKYHQEIYQRWLAMRVEAGVSSPDDLPDRPRCLYPDTPPSPSQMRDAAGDPT